MNSSDTREWLDNGCVVPLESQSAEPVVWVGWGGSRRAAEPEAGHLSVYAPDFFLGDAEPWRVYSCSSRIAIGELSRLLAAERAEPSDGPLAWAEPDFSTFERLFADLQRRIRAGDLKKAVPAVFSRARGGFSRARLACTLRAALNAASDSPLNVYGFWNDSEGMLGATPELLFRYTGPRSISTAAVAGTRPHAARSDSRLPLSDDPKEVEEHQFVVDGIRDAFRSMGSVRVGPTTELRLSNFSHLLAPVDVCFHSPQPFDAVVRALHPTPAVGGWPREAGMEWLAWMEREDEAAGIGQRDRFGAPFGAVTSDGDGVCWVAIRGMQWTHDTHGTELRLAAGCGVTGQSELHREWHELGIKLQAIRTALAV